MVSWTNLVPKPGGKEANFLGLGKEPASRSYRNNKNVARVSATRVVQPGCAPARTWSLRNLVPEPGQGRGVAFSTDPPTA